MPLIQTTDLTKRFGELTAVDRLTFDVADGEIFGLVGPDGAGKTSVLRLLAGLMPPTSGTAVVVGHELTRQSEAIKEQIGYMSQRFGLYPDLSVLENIQFYADIYGVSRRRRAPLVNRLLDLAELSEFRRRLAGQLSGGMKQKLALACALVHRPKLLLLDEPTCGVDPVSRREFWKILYQLVGEEVTILLSTSYLDEAERCGRLALIDRGKLLALGTPHEVKRLLPGEVIELRASDVRAAAHVLREGQAAAGVSLFGDRLHLVTPDAAAARADVARLLEQAGITLDEWQTIEPTLEDVMVSIAGTPAEGQA